MRGTRGPVWPTHRWKRHRLRRTVPEWMTDAEPTPETTQAMARDLVRRGLASPAILGPIPPPPIRHDRREHDTRDEWSTSTSEARR